MNGFAGNTRAAANALPGLRLLFLKLLPHKHQTDGFFAAVFERKPMAKKIVAAKDDADAEAEQE